MSELRLTLTSTYRLRLRLPELVVEWDPLSLDRRSALVELLSPCCEVQLYLPPSATRSDAKSSPSFSSICSSCEAWLPIPLAHLALRFQQQGWDLAREEEWELVMLSLAHPFEATLQKSIVGDTIIKLMNRASAEYAWVPEGNSRGPQPLEINLRKTILKKLMKLASTMEEVSVSE